jgi:hydrogenase nickel incorporation protein HypA/HybF
MHEYSVVRELISALLPRLESHQGDVTAIFLKKGELRILSDIAMKNAFELLASGTRLEGAELIVESVAVRASCDGCGYVGDVDYVKDDTFHYAIPILSCPSCGSEVEIQTGRELYVDRVTLRTDDERETNGD